MTEDEKHECVLMAGALNSAAWRFKPDEASSSEYRALWDRLDALAADFMEKGSLK